MSRRNKIVWGAVSILAVMALSLALLLVCWEKNEDGETAAEPVKTQEEDTKPMEKKAQIEPESREVSLIFTGDVFLSNYVLHNYERAGITGVLDAALLEELRGVDLTVINEEFPFSVRGEQAKDKQFTFRVDPSYVKIFQEMGVDMVTLANNHVLDYGDDALMDTLETLEQAEILYAGAGEQREQAMQLQVKEVNGVRIGMLAASRVIPEVSWNIENHQPGVFCTYDPSLLLEKVRAAKNSCDYLFVYIHWGVERNTEPEEYQKNLARQYIDAGADAIIGSHPHVLQGIEFYQGNPIFYSLGNFIFNQNIERTMAVKLEIDKKGNTQVCLFPATAIDGKTNLLEREKREVFYQGLEEISFGIQIDENGVVTEDTTKRDTVP
ncbi:MAG: CapA family protein [Lachnospiraceae bacterium]|nr:CapA family protein [Lachnospiraceae bacterium]